MAISTEFEQAVSVGNALRVKIMLRNYMISDPSFTSFNEGLNYAQERITDLIDEHDGEELNYDVATWDRDYLDEQMTTVIDNFSEKRIELLRNMCRVIYSDKVEQLQRENFVAEQRNGLSKKQVGTGVAVGGAAAAIVGLALEEPFVVALGAAAVVIGGVLIFTDR